MPAFVIPADPLLQQVMMPQSRDPSPGVRDNTGVQPDDLIGEGDPGLSTDEDNETASNRNPNKRPRLGVDDEINVANADPMHIQNNPHVAQPLATSLRQYAQGLISLKKLSDNSQQELHKYTTASPAERDVMNFALGLEIRDNLHVISAAVVSSSVHPDLTKNIKVYTAAAFFSPFIRFYAPPTNSARNKDLQKSILQQLIASGLSHIPPSSDAAGTNKVLVMISGELTNWRSTVKDELAKRKVGEPNTDIGSFSGRLMRNTTLKITREHYGRIALLSREYSLWEARPGDLMKVKYWEWVDQALERIRDQQKNDPEAVKRFFKEIMTKDEEKFSKAVGKVVSATERDEWQKKVELATSKLA